MLTNSGISLLCKFIAAGIGIVAVPILINTLGVETYGVWVTLVSIIGWLQMSDFGLANGLKNKVAELQSAKDYKGVSSIFIGTMQIYLLIAILLAFLFFLFLNHLGIPQSDLKVSYLLYLPVIFCLPLTLGTAVLSGLRQIGILSCLSIITPVIWFFTLLYINNEKNSSLLQIVLGWSISSIIGTTLICMYALIKTQALKYQLTNLSHLLKALSILKLSGKFFVLQISSIILFSIGNYLVYIYLGANEVARYDTINKLFLFGMTLYNVIIAVVWPEFTHYLTVGSYRHAWQLYKKLVFGTVALCVSIVLGSSLIPKIIFIWTHGKLSVPFADTIPFVFAVCIQMIAYSGAVVLNSVGQISGQIILAILAASGMFPLSTFYFEAGYGIMSVPIATSILTFPAAIYCSLQAYRILSGKLRGE